MGDTDLLPKEVEGTFQGKALWGTYIVTIYGSGNLASTRSLSRVCVQSSGFFRGKGPLVQKGMALLEEGQ